MPSSPPKWCLPPQPLEMVLYAVDRIETNFGGSTAILRASHHRRPIPYNIRRNGDTMGKNTGWTGTRRSCMMKYGSSTSAKGLGVYSDTCGTRWSCCILCFVYLPLYNSRSCDLLGLSLCLCHHFSMPNASCIAIDSIRRNINSSWYST